MVFKSFLQNFVLRWATATTFSREYEMAQACIWRGFGAKMTNFVLVVVLVVVLVAAAKAPCYTARDQWKCRTNTYYDINSNNRWLTTKQIASFQGIVVYYLIIIWKYKERFDEAKSLPIHIWRSIQLCYDVQHIADAQRI